MTKPAMTAEELRKWYYDQPHGTRQHPDVMARMIDNVLALLAASEAHDAEIAALKAQVGEMGKRMEDDGR